MSFRNWLLSENMRDLARAYTDALRDVPQDPDHHPEGSVLNHVKLVRKSIRYAAEELKNLKNSPILGEILSEIDFSLDEEEMQVLALSAWLHDVGKSSATTVGGVHHLLAKEPGKVQAIGHESPKHYGPQINMLSSVAPKWIVNIYERHRDLVNFLIERHMDFAHGGFSKAIVADYFVNGILKNDRKMKLLLVLMWADKLGRGKVTNLEENVKKLKEAADRSRRNYSRTSRPFSGGEDEFRDMLKSRGLSDREIEAAVRSKFG